MSDIVKAKRKTENASEWRGTVGVSFGDTTLDIPHRLLTETETQEVKEVVDFSELTEFRDEEASEAREELMELQSKDADDLTDEERERIRELTRQVDDSGIEDALGDDAKETFMWAGHQAIAPTDEDVSEALSDPEQQELWFGDKNVTSHSEAHECIKAELQQMAEDQPYPIKTQVGMQAFIETLNVLGNGLQNE